MRKTGLATEAGGAEPGTENVGVFWQLEEARKWTLHSALWKEHSHADPLI